MYTARKSCIYFQTPGSQRIYITMPHPVSFSARPKAMTPSESLGSLRELPLPQSSKFLVIPRFLTMHTAC